MNVGLHEDKLLDKVPRPHKILGHDFHSLHLPALSHFLNVHNEFLLLPLQCIPLTLKLTNHLEKGGGKRRGGGGGERKRRGESGGGGGEERMGMEEEMMCGS